MPLRLGLVIAGLLALTGLLTAAFAAMLATITQAVPPEFALGMGLLPSNTAICMGVCVTSSIARWVYDVHAKILFEVVGGSLL